MSSFVVEQLEENDSRAWKPEENNSLKCAVKMYSSATGRFTDWKKVADKIGHGRTAQECKERWLQVESTDISYEPWTTEEDMRLLKFFARLGNERMTTVHTSFNSNYPSVRTHVQCVARLKELLNNDFSQSAANRYLTSQARLEGQNFEEKSAKMVIATENGKVENAKLASAESNAVNPDFSGKKKVKKVEERTTKEESSGKKKVKKVKIEEPTKEEAVDDKCPASVVGANSEGLPEKGEGLTLLINSYSDGLAVLQEDYEES